MTHVKPLGAACCAWGVLFLTAAFAPAQEPGAATSPATAWRAVHLMAPGRDEIPALKKTIDEGLKPLGINAVVLEINYGFRYQSHPELGDGGWSRTDARDLAAYCRERGI